MATNPDTEIWVADWRDGDWIDARSAHYLAGQQTPMGYGLGAQQEAAPRPMVSTQAQAGRYLATWTATINDHAGQPRPTAATRDNDAEHLWLTAWADIIESLRAKWFLVYTPGVRRHGGSAVRSSASPNPASWALPACRGCW